ncbi:uncharacterized protein LOC110823085 [Carica papaya]|uniref:uncharacterized protein LOC110823085 n=1 Tax=Carica papaya TaxID=3649 RepID=UPI000B8D058F|nr:uncharacterized protein LOC110823085 [Carica papaya]
MLVLNMNSKRQRRPNVRLGEIGDVSAAFACGVSQKTAGDLGHKRWKPNFTYPIENELDIGSSRQKSSEFLVSDPGVSPRASADLQQNRENKNPNSLKQGSDFVGSDDMTNSNLNFGTITRKSRVMRRKGRSSVSNSVFGGAWSSKVSPRFSSEDGKASGDKEFAGFTLDGFGDNGFKELSDHETPATSKEACEYDVDETGYDVWQQGYASNCWKEKFCYEANNKLLKYGQGSEETRSEGSDVNNVRRWLKDQGFGKYAGIFEMHEVDEEALPLLTLEDLKEIGVYAVGPRRKLYSAIQQLKREETSA